MENELKEKNEDPAIHRLIGYVIVFITAWLFFDSTKMTTLPFGYLTSFFPRGGFWDTTSMAVIFLPLLAGLVWVVYTFLSGGNQKWAKILSWSGLAILAIEVLSRVRFHMVMKTSSFLILLAFFATGLALLLRARIVSRKLNDKSSKSATEKKDEQ